MTRTQQYIENRTIEEAKYIINNMETVRNASKHFGVSKSTIHKDITQRLLNINRGLAEDVAIVMELNSEEKHIRGGESTKNKYKGVM
jgi:putative DeoR family transcriptional regulator (stage III sporulation protein D)